MAFCSGCVSAGTPQSASEPEEHDGLWRFRYDNDSMLFTDGNYSSGIQLGHLSKALETRQPSSFSARLARWLAPLPGLGNPEDKHYVSYNFGQLIFTPEDLTARNPGPDELPYTGLLFIDTGVYARSADSLSAYHLLLGVTGEPSLGEEAQKTLHEAFNQGRPRGWSHQSRDEPIINLGYEYHQRLARGSLNSQLEWDCAYDAGGALGNFLTGLNAGVRLRLGRRLPAELGAMTLNTGFESSSVPLHRPGPAGDWHAFAGIQTYAIGRYLPVDGNFLQDGRSTAGEPLVASASLGFSLSTGSMAITLAYNVISDTYESQSETTQVGSISLDFFP